MTASLSSPLEWHACFLRRYFIPSDLWRTFGLCYMPSSARGPIFPSKVIFQRYFEKWNFSRAFCLSPFNNIVSSFPVHIPRTQSIHSRLWGWTDSRDQPTQMTHVCYNRDPVDTQFQGAQRQLSRFSRVRLLATPWTAAYQAPLPMGFSRQEY